MPSSKLREQPVRRSQRVRKKRLLGPGKGIDNPSAVVAVLLARAGQQQQLYDDQLEREQYPLYLESYHNRLQEDKWAKKANLDALAGRYASAQNALVEWEPHHLRRGEIIRELRELRLGNSPTLSKLSQARNSVLEEVVRHSEAFKI